MQTNPRAAGHDTTTGAGNPAATGDDGTTLWRRWEALRDAHPNLRARDAAARLGVTEAELLDCHPDSHRLAADWGAILRGLRDIGPVMALTRNHGVVIEKTGPVEEVEIYPAHRMGQVVGAEVDLRLFLGQWAFGFAATEATRSGQRQSFQFFDAHGVAVHKVYRVEGTDGDAWTALVAAQRDPASSPIEIAAPEPPMAPTPDAEIDLDGLRSGWLGMSNTHDFFGLLRKYKVERRQALRLAGSDLARPTAAGSYRAVLELARDSGLEIMLFVGNPGCLQIHTGSVERLETVGQWFNVMDPGFNLHVWQPAITDAWLVRKPTDQGVITSLECYDDAGELLLQCFGKRKGEATESPHWRALLGTATGAEEFVEVAE
jgi:putative hemin transport protein